MIDIIASPVTSSACNAGLVGSGVGGSWPSSIQVLVKLDNCKTYCLNFPCHYNSFSSTTITTATTLSSCPIHNSIILEKLSQVSSIPVKMLKLHDKNKNDNNNYNHIYNYNFNYNSTTKQLPTTLQYFLSAYTHLPIRGGKGGFGTLLKGQSKQAGARQTVDFGACRDLNGRRLRHVNDEIKLRKWRENMQRKMEKSLEGNHNKSSSGEIGDFIDIEEEIEQLRTASGIRNWHLMVPNWSDIGSGGLSSKSRRRLERGLRREVEKMAQEKRQEFEDKRRKKDAWEQSIANYANINDEYSKRQEEKMTNSILVGFQKRKKRKLEDTEIVKSIDDDSDSNDIDEESLIFSASSICTLSGDVILEENNIDDHSSNATTLIQSKSEFASTAVLLNASKFKEMSTSYHGLYYEIEIKTCGVAQLGWAILSVEKDGAILPSTGKDGFLPNSDTGDGVGDDDFSYGFDGLRNLLFHSNQEKSYGKSRGWKEGDIVGCMYNYRKGEIQYSINGEDFGVAFEVKKVPKDDSEYGLLYPCFSLNENEFVGLNTGPSFRHCPEDYLGIGALLESRKDHIASTNRKELKPNISIAVEHHDEGQDKASESKAISKKVIDEPKDATCNEPIDLDNFESAKDLESVGPDRLKNTLFSLGCKCGGSLQERAIRLFSTKGLRREDFPTKIRGKNFS